MRPILRALRGGVLLPWALWVAPPRLGAQARPAVRRPVERHEFDDPDGRLLGFYSALVTFSPVDARVVARPWSVDVGGELSLVPRLNRAQRTTDFEKPEAANLPPVVPRPRIAIWLPRGVRVEGSWTPPVRLAAVTGELYALALSAPVTTVGGVAMSGRVSYTGGRVSGAITCYGDLGRGDVSQRDYYFHVCHSRVSDDRFEPAQWAGEVMVTLPARFGAVAPYVGVGAQRERTRFDVGVINPDGSRALDHPILALDATRPYGMAGASWRPGRLVRLSSELFYAPGSLLTVRTLASLHLRDR